MSNLTEREMRERDAGQVLDLAGKLLLKSIKARRAGMYAMAADLADKAAYHAKGGSVLCQALADEKRAAAERKAMREAAAQ